MTGRAARLRAGIQRNKTAVWYERSRVGMLIRASDGGRRDQFFL